MAILLVLIPLGLVLLGLAVAAFVWAVRHGQFEELEGEGMRILLDDDDHPAPDPAPAPETLARETTPPERPSARGGDAGPSAGKDPTGTDGAT